MTKVEKTYKEDEKRNKYIFINVMESKLPLWNVKGGDYILQNNSGREAQKTSFYDLPVVRGFQQISNLSSQSEYLVVIVWNIITST